MTSTQTEQLTAPELAVVRASQLRRSEVEEADVAHRRALDAANARFAAAIRDAGVPITRVATLVDVNRQRVHDILRSYPADATATASATTETFS